VLERTLVMYVHNTSWNYPIKKMFVVDIFCSFVKVRFVRATMGCAFSSLLEVVMHGYR
jgi:hypothetical protein